MALVNPCPCRDIVFVQYHEQLGRAVSGAQAKQVGLSPTSPTALEVMVNHRPDLNKIAYVKLLLLVG